MKRAVQTAVRDLPNGSVIVADPDAMSMTEAYGYRKVSYANGWLVVQPVRLMHDRNGKPFWDADPHRGVQTHRYSGRTTLLAITEQEN